MTTSNLIKYLFISFCLLQIGDMLTTYYALHYTGLQEYNPLMKSTIDLIGVFPAFVLIKVIGIALIGYMLLKINVKWRLRTLIFCSSFYVFVVGSNLYQILGN